MAGMHIIIPHPCKWQGAGGWGRGRHQTTLQARIKIESCLVVVTWRKELTLVVWISSPIYSTRFIHSKSLTVLKIKCREAGFFWSFHSSHYFLVTLHSGTASLSLSYCCFCNIILWGLSYSEDRNICIAVSFRIMHK